MSSILDGYTWWVKRTKTSRTASFSLSSTFSAFEVCSLRVNGQKQVYSVHWAIRVSNDSVSERSSRSIHRENGKTADASNHKHDWRSLWGTRMLSVWSSRLCSSSFSVVVYRVGDGWECRVDGTIRTASDIKRISMTTTKDRVFPSSERNNRPWFCWILYFRNSVCHIEWR